MCSVRDWQKRKHKARIMNAHRKGCLREFYPEEFKIAMRVINVEPYNGPIQRIRWS